jgi:alpha-N-arabinofuranosidase
MSSLQRLIVLADEPIATINPFLHGQFAEHLGELIYPGIYVPLDGPIPNINGIRKDVVEALKPLELSVLRWPGGCFADIYHWRDGIGPKESRPKRVNLHWNMAEEPNSFGTHEFMEFVKAIGAEPYFAANLGSAPPAEMQNWIEYCNFEGNSTLANERRANGAADPFRVNYWGIGNENWGCGGNQSPSEYASLYAQYQSFAFNFPNSPITKIACGPNGGDWNWTRKFFDTLSANGRINTVQGFAAHYYCWTAGTATEYTDSQWKELLSKAAAIEGIVTGHRQILDEYDPERKIKLILDEWGTWHPVEPGKPGGGLYQQNTVRDAAVAGITLDTFHNHADKLFMANIAQIINVLQALLLVDGDKVVKTPTYHVFDLYKAHKGAIAVRTVAASDIISYGEGPGDNHANGQYITGKFPGLKVIQGSASIKDKTLVVTAVNADPAQATEVEISTPGISVSKGELTILAADDIHAHNTFDNPNNVVLGAPTTVEAKNGVIRIVLPKGAVARFVGVID